MMNDFDSLNSLQAPEWLIWLPFLLLVVFLWTAFWKGLALWHAGRRGQPWWFVLLFFVNTLGLLEIIYLFGIAKVKANKLFSK